MGTTSPTITEDRAPESPSSPVAPLVPIMIVPVNAAENNTATSSPPPGSMHTLPRPTNTNDDSAAVTVIQENALAEEETISEAPKEKSPEPTPVPSNEVVEPPGPGPTPADEAKPEGDLSTDSEEKTSDDKKPVGDAVVETIVKPIVVEDSPVERAVTETVVERTPIHVIEPVGAVELPVTGDYPTVDQPSVNTAYLNGTATALPATTADIEAESVSTSSAIPTVAQVITPPSLPAVIGEDSRADESIVAAVVPLTESNLVTEEKAQTPSSVPEIKAATSPSSNEHSTKTIIAGEFAEPSVIAPESPAVNTTAVAEGEVAEPIPATNGHTPAIPPKETPSTSSPKGARDFPSSQTNSLSQSVVHSSSSSKFGSSRKKRTSFLAKIKHILHLDKEKEK